MGFFFSVDKKDKDAKAAIVPGLPSLDEPIPFGTFGSDVAPAAPAPARTALDWTLDEVFAGGGAEPGRNSALTVLKLLAGLQALPAEARLVAVRAMDSADDTWDETHVVADARKRVAILQQFIGFIDKDVEERLAAVTATFTEAKAATEGRVAELDRQIAELKAQRDAALSEVTAAKAAGEEQGRAVQARAKGLKDSVQAEVEKYKGLVAFFGTPPAK